MARTFKPAKPSRHAAQVTKATLSIDSVDAHGKGVASKHQPVAFVEGGLPGEVCEVQVTQRKKRFWQSRVSKVLEPAPERRVPFCPHFAECGGCQTQHADPMAMSEWKQDAIDSQLKRMTGLASLPWQTPIRGEARGYRRRARLAVDARNKQKIKLGLRTADNRVFSLQQCGILAPQLQALLLPLQSLIQSMDAPQSVGHVLLFAADNGRQVTLRVVKTLGDTDASRLQVFAEQQNVQVLLDTGGQSHDIFGCAQPMFYTPESGVELHVQPDDFVQVNNGVNQAMVAQAMDWLAPDETDKVLDLFCGLGNFSLPLAKRTAAVLGIEGSTKMVQRARENAQRNGIQNLEFEAADLTHSQSLALISAFSSNKLLLDPARDGALEVMPLIAGMGLQKVVYVSCNPATFARDCAVLLDQNYHLAKISLMDMFPQTAHTELMALFVPQV